MSEKGVLFKKRKNNHGSHHGSSRGYGCLYPMVKISDYKKALEKYESEQKETCNSEG